MRISFECRHCHALLETEATAAGSDVTCPTCGGAIKVPSANLGPGATLGAYRIESKLGVGGMGEVYLATQLSMDRQVALKVLPSHMSMRKELADRFLNELKLLARLEHPNIVTAFDAGSDAGMLFFAMAYVKGQSAEDHLCKHGVFGEREALAIARKLANALAYAWNKHQLLHRDIKPSNILFDENGEPRLVDFGLAKSLTAEQGLTMSNTMLGTPNYMSPEQVEGGAPVDVRADMYSLGGTLYHMLTGDMPFAGSSVMEIIRKQLTESLPDPRTFNPRLSDGVVELIEILLSKPRESRYDTWEALVADIDRVLSGNSPSREVPATGSSTLVRLRDKAALEALKKTPHVKQPVFRPNAAPKVVVQEVMDQPQDEMPGRFKPIRVIAAGVVGLLVLGAILVFALRPKQDKAQQADALPLLAAGTAVVAQASTSNTTAAGTAKQAYGEAIEYRDAHPEDPAGILGRFEAVRKTAAGTEYEQKADEQILKAEDQRKQTLQQAWSELKNKADALTAQDKYADALALLAAYSGPYAADLAARRDAHAAGISRERDEKAKRSEAEAAKQREAEVQADRQKQEDAAKIKLAAVLAETADSFLKAAYADAARDLEAALQNPALAQVKPDLERAMAEVRSLADQPRRILASFKAQAGKQADVEFADGRVEPLRIVEVTEVRVKATRQVANGQVGREFTPNDLSAAERLKRAGAPTAIGLGVLAARAGKYLDAAAALKKADSAFAQAIAARLGEQQAVFHERQAKREFEGLLARAGYSSEVKDPDKAAETIASKTWSQPMKESLSRAAIDFREKYGDSAIARSNDIIIIAFEGLAPTDKAGQAAVPRPQLRMPTATPATVAQSAAKAMTITDKKTDPAPEKKRDPKSEKAEKDAKLALAEILKIAGFGPDWDKPDDLLPRIAAKPFSTEETTRLAAALEAMERDFGPTEFIQKQWRILDFLKQAGPEARAPYLQTTDENLKRAAEEALRDNADNSIGVSVKRDPSQGAAVGIAMVGGPVAPPNKYADVRSLKWLAVEYLGSRVPLSDWAVLRTWRLKRVELTLISFDANAIAGLPLTGLVIYSCEIRNMDKLATLTTLKFLAFYTTPTTRNLNFTKGMQLTRLFISGPISDLSPLKGQPLESLEASGTEIKDLTPLADAPLTSYLRLDSTKVIDISPLAGKPIASIDISNTEVTDLTPLASMPLLTRLTLGHPKKALDMVALEGKRLGSLGITGKIASFAPFANIKWELGKGGSLSLRFPDWEKTPEADKLPEYIPELKEIQVQSISKRGREILLRFPNLEKITVVSPPQTVTMEELRKQK